MPLRQVPTFAPLDTYMAARRRRTRRRPTRLYVQKGDVALMTSGRLARGVPVRVLHVYGNAPRRYPGSRRALVEMLTDVRDVDGTVVWLKGSSEHVLGMQLAHRRGRIRRVGPSGPRWMTRRFILVAEHERQRPRPARTGAPHAA